MFAQFSDINQVCISGVGSSMIKNAASAAKLSIQSIVGGAAPTDAIALIEELLVFNPHKRLKASEALSHDYVANFHDLDQETSMPSHVAIPLNDDVRLSVDDYRNTLYELMSSQPLRHCPKPSPDKQKVFVPEVHSRVSKNTEKYIRSHVNLKDHSQVMSQSESKIYQKNSSWVKTAQVNKSDSKVPIKYGSLDKSNTLKGGGGDCRMHMKSKTEAPKRRITPPKPTVYQSFNSFNRSHGIITQSALMELRAAGQR